MNPPDLNALSLPALFAEFARTGLVRRLFELARDEDLGQGPHAGDITTRAWLPPTSLTANDLVARERGTIAGLEALPILLEIFAPTASVTLHHADGQLAEPGENLATISGPTHEVLALERPMLNLLSRLSGIATLTAKYRDAIGTGTRAKLFDTRKTTPGLRVLEKYAVRCGGGYCHRIGLHDAVLVKDNHVAAVPAKQLAAHTAAAAMRARADRPLRFIEIEVDSLEQLRELLTLETRCIDIILLDNMPAAVLREAVALRDRANPELQLEASGGVNLTTIRAIAESGVDRISVGALTHSAVALDLGLDAA